MALGGLVWLGRVTVLTAATALVCEVLAAFFKQNGPRLGSSLLRVVRVLTGQVTGSVWSVRVG
jgi:hypothetical protein